MSNSKVMYEFGPFRIDMERYLLLRGEEAIPLSPKVFETLLFLVEHRGQVGKKDEIINSVWPDTFVEESNLAQNVFLLRKALGEEKNEHRYIVIIPGVGYRFVAPVKETAVAGAHQNDGSGRAVGSVAVLPFKNLSGEGTALPKTICELFAESEHERIVLWSDQSCGYRGIIAIHSTALGPAVGGTRFWNYDCDKVASLDALRLSRAMSYKNALAGVPFGGGKAVIIGRGENCDREGIFRAHGKFIESLHGCFITAEDIGTTPDDMELVSQETKYVAGLPGKSGNPSPKTAYGVFRALQACAMHRWGTDSLEGRTVAVQGCGSTGYYLARKLHEAGARLIVCDVDPARSRRVVNEFSAMAVEPNEVFDHQSDVFSPCAMGGIINDETIARLKAEIVVGSANNQLLEDSHGEALAQRDILYAPDYVANSGGVINGCRELLGWDEASTLQKIDGIYDRMLELFKLADSEGVPPFKTADRLAQKLIDAAKGQAGWR